ncbi:hypothetical protein [Methylotetracoccus oryzae]|uniref:hypothetical protein n=1 Tax=Methylotetracoccus oryzae TaxID=1919059 RepID=UPI001118834C|nr:hypothetical protein [Methylotetracoccus oryzae]
MQCRNVGSRSGKALCRQQTGVVPEAVYRFLMLAERSVASRSSLSSLPLSARADWTFIRGKTDSVTSDLCRDPGRCVKISAER